MAWNNAPSIDVVIDIETVAIPPTEAEIEEARASWKPKGNVKDPEKIEAQRQAYFADLEQSLIDERGLSLGGKRMICCALGTISTTSNTVVDIESRASDDLSYITKWMCAYLDELNGAYNLIGWNHVSFDLPEIAKSFYRTKVKPQRKPTKWGVFDLCKHPFYRLSLKQTAKDFGLEVMDVRGSDVAKMYQDGEWARIKEYNEYDVKITGELYLAASTIFTF